MLMLLVNLLDLNTFIQFPTTTTTTTNPIQLRNLKMEEEEELAASKLVELCLKVF